MTTDDEAMVIAAYERLRAKLDQLNEQSDRVDARLVELEPLLPDDYVYPGDPDPR